MAASGRRRKVADITSWVGHGVPMPGSQGLQVVIAPRLLRVLRRHVANIDAMSDVERDQLRAVLTRIVRAVSMTSSDVIGPKERDDIDDLLRKAGLPPLDAR